MDVKLSPRSAELLTLALCEYIQRAGEEPEDHIERGAEPEWWRDMTLLCQEMGMDLEEVIRRDCSGYALQQMKKLCGVE